MASEIYLVVRNFRVPREFRRTNRSPEDAPNPAVGALGISGGDPEGSPSSYGGGVGGRSGVDSPVVYSRIGWPGRAVGPGEAQGHTQATGGLAR